MSPPKTHTHTSDILFVLLLVTYLFSRFFFVGGGGQCPNPQEGQGQAGRPFPFCPEAGCLGAEEGAAAAGQLVSAGAAAAARGAAAGP